MLYELLEKNRMLTTDAVICGEEKITYEQLYQKSKHLSKKISTEASATVILFMPNSIQYVIAYFAVLACNKIVYPISALSKSDELVSAVVRTGANLIICTKDQYSEIKSICHNLNTKIVVVHDSEFWQLDEHESTYFPTNLKKPNDICLFLNTSGSTDAHKIVMLTQENIQINCKDWVMAALNPTNAGRVLVAMPVCTSFGTVVLTTCIMLGWTVVFIPSFLNSANILQSIEKNHITHLISIGSMLNILAKDLAELPPSSNEQLEFIGIGGNKAVPETMLTLLNYFPNVGLSPGYGLTEATCMVATISPDISRVNRQLFDRKSDSAGKPFKHSNIKILPHKNFPDGIGEILIKGPILMAGYYHNSQKTKETLVDQYLHTGDLGYLDKDGYLYIVGRIKNIIKTGGYTVFPEEIENVLFNSGLVKDAYVYGVPDPLLDEKVIADVILSNKCSTPAMIEHYCLQHLAAYKVPTKIRLVTAISKTKNGKTQRKV